MSNLPTHSPPGHKRYKAYSRPVNSNPFRGQGVSNYTQTVDIKEEVTFEEVEQFARAAAKNKGYDFLHLEVVE